MVLADGLAEARESFERQAWRDAYELFSQAAGEGPLCPEDVSRLAAAAYMLGKDAECIDLWAHAHHDFLANGDPESAARCAFLIGIELMNRGQSAHSSGWLARARRVLDDAGQTDSVVRGYLLIPEGIRITRTGDHARANELFGEAIATGQRFGDNDLVAWGRQGQGRTLIRMGNHAEGVALLDEVMVAATAGELLPMSVGTIYCSVIDACSEIFDLRRAHEWTAALSQWCAQQPEGVPYGGVCLIHRAEILQLHGSWADAMQEVERACEELVAPPPKVAAGRAYYQRGELHRLRGEYEKAEDAYRRASELGKKPQPGFARLRLAQGDAHAAFASIRRAVEETREPSPRARVLSAFVEIALAANDVRSARDAAHELETLATKFQAPFVRALAAYCAGSVTLAEGNTEDALTSLQSALAIWRDIEAPYEEAQTRVLIAKATRTLGDEDSANLELEVAKKLFERLGAVSDVARLDELATPKATAPATPLTPRELEVLGLVATGKTNRGIADSLGLSEKTVARHLSNIFTKLGLSSRAAATAYAYRKGLV